MKRIMVVVPVCNDLWNESARRLMDRHKGPDTKLDVANVEKGPDSLECTYDEAYAELSTVRMAESAEREGCDGVIIYCFGDPGLRAAKETLSIPVTGLGEASMHIASLLGTRFSIISAGPVSHFPNQRRRLLDKLRVYGFDHKCASIRSLKIPVLDLGTGKEEESRRLLEEARKAVEEDGADTIVLGCGSIFGAEKKISDELSVPVIVPGVAALGICEAMIRMGLAQSKRCFATPPEKRRIT